MHNKKIIKFSDIRQDIIFELHKRAQDIGIAESVTLVEGFVNQPFGMELSGTYIIGGPTIPMIMLLGNTTGRIYFFALKALLRNIEL